MRHKDCHGIIFEFQAHVVLGAMFSHLRWSTKPPRLRALAFAPQHLLSVASGNFLPRKRTIRNSFSDEQADPGQLARKIGRPAGEP
jgi:hypothetical protein